MEHEKKVSNYKGSRGWLNDLDVPLEKRMAYISEHGGSTPFAEYKDYGPCPVKTCKDPEMQGKCYIPIPLWGKNREGVIQRVCPTCADEFWSSEDREAWEKKAFRYEIK